MKKYICTKTVLARPLSKWLAYNTGILVPGNAVTENDRNVPGYELTIDENGYLEWKSKEAFEKEFRLAETPLDRMRIEIAELSEKIGKLSKFIKSERFKDLDEDMQNALRKQHYHMDKYYEALSSRIIMMMEHDKNTENNGK